MEAWILFVFGRKWDEWITMMTPKSNRVGELQVFAASSMSIVFGQSS